MEKKEEKTKFVCGNCIYNEDGLCDMLGWFVEDDDAPHCAHGKNWESRYILKEVK